MSEPLGPGSPFSVCFDEQLTSGATLPASFQEIYSPWPLPDPTDRPYVYANFVTSRDGRVSFNVPRHMGGGDVSRHNAYDRWLMGLLRARADAVLLGASSLEAAGNHIWTAARIAPDDTAAWADLRHLEGRADVPLQVIITRSGKIEATDAPVFHTPGLPVLLATTKTGLQQASSLLAIAPHVEVYAPSDTFDLGGVLRHLRDVYGVHTLLVEAGPQVYGSLHAAHLLDDEFVTLSPILIGNTQAQPRPSLIEGVAFNYNDPPQSKLLSVHRQGDYLFLHSRYSENTRTED